MSTGPVFPIRKTANMFFKGEENRLNPIWSWITNYETRGLARGVLKFYDGLWGGAWVGGTATLHSDRLTFASNDLNNAVLAHPYDLEILLADIRTVDVVRTMVTTTVELTCGDGRIVRFRCWGAASFAESIRQARKLQGA